MPTGWELLEATKLWNVCGKFKFLVLKFIFIIYLFIMFDQNWINVINPWISWVYCTRDILNFTEHTCLKKAKHKAVVASSDRAGLPGASKRWPCLLLKCSRRCYSLNMPPQNSCGGNLMPDATLLGGWVWSRVYMPGICPSRIKSLDKGNLVLSDLLPSVLWGHSTFSAGLSTCWKQGPDPQQTMNLLPP
jgi:hypothetical protein